jgi:hypothetical protein
MVRYLLTPTPEQAAVTQGHCAHARFVRNLAAGHAVTARGGPPHPGRPLNREPQAA